VTDAGKIGSNVSIALLHYPVYNKNRHVVAAAITNLDLHDIARAARTFGLHRYFVVTPLAEQRELAERIVGHWREGFGATYNPKRKAALEMIRVRAALVRDLAQPYLLLLGTGWGLTDELFDKADYVLAPIKGAGDYNHLPVRSAAAIILDRLLGN
jgi:hypothetical protein